ncbi:MAG: PqqD family protein [Blastocatellia bacterium]
MKKTTENPAAQARNDELVVQDLPDEVLVYDLKSHKAHCLNKTAAFIWRHCDGQTTADEIAKMMQQEWETPVTEDAVWFALNKLSKAELLQERIVLPEAKAGMSRRSAVRRLGFGALLAVPVVMSIVTPTPAAAASVPPECIACTSFGGTGNRANTCPPVCATVPGCCFGNASCSTGAGNFLAPTVGCDACFNNFPGDVPNPGDQPSKGWRASLGAPCV